MKLPKVPSLVRRTKLSKLAEKQRRSVVQEVAGKIAPQGGRGTIPQWCTKTDDGGCRTDAPFGRCFKTDDGGCRFGDPW